MNMSVCVSVCVSVSVCPVAYLMELHVQLIFTNSGCRTPWLGLPLTALRYVVYNTSGFDDNVMFSHRPNNSQK